MSVYTIDRAAIVGKAGALLSQLDASLLRVQQLKAFLDTITDNQLITNYGFVQGDIDILRSALADTEQLRTIYQGSTNLASAKDFRMFTKLVYAFGSI